MPASLREGPSGIGTFGRIRATHRTGWGQLLEAARHGPVLPDRDPSLRSSGPKALLLFVELEPELERGALGPA